MDEIVHEAQLLDDRRGEHEAVVVSGRYPGIVGAAHVGNDPEGFIAVGSAPEQSNQDDDGNRHANQPKQDGTAHDLSPRSQSSNARSRDVRLGRWIPARLERIQRRRKMKVPSFVLVPEVLTLEESRSRTSSAPGRPRWPGSRCGRPFACGVGGLPRRRRGQQHLQRRRAATSGEGPQEGQLLGYARTVRRKGCHPPTTSQHVFCCAACRLDKKDFGVYYI